MSGPAIPADQRPVDRTPVDTTDLPDTPVRDRNIPAGAWRQAPAELLGLGDDLDGDEATYKRRIGHWLLWRSGPASRGRARYLALNANDVSVQYSFTLAADGSGSGTGPSGTTHDRFRTWKEDLLGRPNAGTQQ